MWAVGPPSASPGCTLHLNRPAPRPLGACDDPALRAGCVIVRAIARARTDIEVIGAPREAAPRTHHIRTTDFRLRDLVVSWRRDWSTIPRTSRSRIVHPATRRARCVRTRTTWSRDGSRAARQVAGGSRSVRRPLRSTGAWAWRSRTDARRDRSHRPPARVAANSTWTAARSRPRWLRGLSPSSGAASAPARGSLIATDVYAATRAARHVRASARARRPPRSSMHLWTT